MMQIHYREHTKSQIISLTLQKWKQIDCHHLTTFLQLLYQTFSKIIGTGETHYIGLLKISRMKYILSKTQHKYPRTVQRLLLTIRFDPCRPKMYIQFSPIS